MYCPNQNPCHYSYLIRWSVRDDAYVCTIAEFGFLSFIAESHERALMGATDLVHHVLLDMEASGEAIPTPLGVP